MDSNYSALTFEEVAVARAAIRVFRYLAVVLTAVLVPVVVVVVTPLVGWALVAAVVFSPVVFAYVLVLAARQAAEERRRAAP